MTSSRRFVLTDNAERDFRSILRYTQQHWGRQRRDTYADRLVAAIDRLALFPSMGNARDDLGNGVRAIAVEHHLIIYHLENGTVVILRLLHQNMDATAHLDV
jgi:toxin ParE1/3/4